MITHVFVGVAALSAVFQKPKLHLTSWVTDADGHQGPTAKSYGALITAMQKSGKWQKGPGHPKRRFGRFSVVFGGFWGQWGARLMGCLVL